MATLDTSMLSIPGTSLGIIVDNAGSEGILGKLAPEKPTLFGPVKGATFGETPRASIVGEKEAKPAADITLTPFTAEPVKLVVQVRTSDEFKWADEDWQLGIIDDLVAPAFGKSIGRAADLFAFHGINPATGTVSQKAVKYLTQTTKSVEVADKPTAEIVQAVGLAGGTTNGLALDGGYAFSVATEVNPLTGAELNPGLGFGDFGAFKGLKAAKSTTVSGVPEMTDSKVRALVGDWSQVRWGFQRNFPLEMVEYGDPDNTGRDLKGHNEILLRSEAVIYVAIGDLNKFAKITENPTKIVG